MKRLILVGAIAVATSFSIDAALTKDFYGKKSVLSEGKWVKIGVEKTGVYEISYETLREMGFTDPAKVALYGRGGRVLSESFVTNAGVPVLTDDLKAVKVLHEDGKLYFYGLGPEEVGFEANDAFGLGGYFSRKSNNIYTRRGYYFLTDSKSVTSMSTMNYDTSSSAKVTEGVSYVYHELDSVQNTTRSGQLFWGERLSWPSWERRKWEVEMPDAISGDGVMECVIYIMGGEDREYGDAYVNYGFEGETKYSSTPWTDPKSLYYAPHNPTTASIGIPGEKGTVFAEFAGNMDMSDYVNLDFWVVSYRSEIPSMEGVNSERLNQRLIAFPTIGRNTTGKIELENPGSLVVLDVSTAAEPQKLTIKQSGAIGTVGVRNTSKTPVLVVFDKDKPQYQISGYEESYTQIANQNLHAYQEEGADLIIISTPTFKPYAEEIAQLHRDYDGIKVVVTTPEECYNEFSQGTPDPMAYRSFAKMLYFHETRKPKNILLLGPLYGDMRGMEREVNPSEAIIAYQSPSISVTRGAHNINDFYGMMSDKFRTDYYEKNDVQVGVGILPVKFESDARIVVDKIKKYLERDDHAYFLNKLTSVGGLLDEHTHEIQVRDIGNHIRALDNYGTIFTPIPIDSYGNAEARKKFINQINDGCNMFSYFGHGAEQFLGKDRNFFTAGDVYTLRNNTQPLGLFGGCLITNSDRGYRGLGETIVTSTPFGCIGTIVSSRETWSGQNYEFFKQLFTCLYTEGSTTSSTKRSKPVTIGEVFAAVKNYSTYSNELAYQLLCDPALVIPTVNRTIGAQVKGQSELQPGDKFGLSGTITKFDGTADTDFNGQVVVRITEPERTVDAGMVETKQDPKTLKFTYRDEQVAMMVADVKNGKFDIDIHIPASLSTYSGQDALVYFSAYDPETRIGASQGYTIKIGNPGSASAESKDNKSPVIESLEFDNTDCAISFTVSDNLALNMSVNPLDKGIYLYIDGKERSEAHFVEPILETGRAAYSKNVYIDGLAYGEHTARLKVKDVAGNSSEREILFTYQPAKAKFKICRDDENSTASVTIVKIEGTSPDNATLVIVSSTGNEVWRGEFSGDSITWDHEGATPGHYKGYLIETGSGSFKGHSDPIDLPVI